MKLRGGLYFSAALIIFFIAYSFQNNLYTFSQTAKEREYVNNVQKALEDQITISNTQNEKVLDYVSEDKDFLFSDLLSRVDLPFYLYKNNALVFWSDYKIVPYINWLKGSYIYKFIKSPQGKFLAVKRSLLIDTEHYEAITLIRLTYKYPIKNQYLKSGFNRLIFPENILEVNNFEADYNIQAPSGELLFSLEFNKDANFSDEVNQQKFLAIVFFGFIFLFLGLSVSLKSVKKKFGVDVSFIVLAIFLILVRVVFLAIQVPEKIGFTEFKLAEMLANILCIFFITSYFFNNILHSTLLKAIILFGESRPYLLLVLLLILNAGFLSGLYTFYANIFMSNSLTFDIADVTMFSYIKLLTLAGALLLSIVYFMLAHLCSRFLYLLDHKLTIPGYSVSLLFFGLIALSASYLFGITYLIIAFLSTGYLLLISKTELSSTFTRFRYVTYLYFFICGVLCSVTGAYAAFQTEKLKSEKQLQLLAEKINKEGEFIDFYRLKAISDSIKSDRFIQNSFSNPFYEKETVEQKILKIYLGDGFDKFESNIYLFEKHGNCINRAIKGSYYTYLLNYKKARYKTQYKNIFQIRDAIPLYYSFIELPDKGFVILEFKLRKVVPNSVFPELLLDKNKQASTSGNYSYAIYKNRTLVSSFGPFNYFKELGMLSDNEHKQIIEGYAYLGKYHKLFAYNEGRDIIVSIPYYSIKQVFSNFSFLFLLQSIVLAGFIFSNTFYFKLRQVSTTFTTKIQLFINFAFFLPLVVVSITTFSAISSYFESEIQNNFIKKAEEISASLVQPLSDFSKRKITEDKINETLNQISKYIQSDINLYSPDGKLIYTNQSVIFESNLISTYINPRAFESLVENKETSRLIQESVGKLNYNTVYYRIKSYDSGKLLGILAIPYFESNMEFRSKIVEALTTILNIFTIIFILFLVLSYFASRFLTVPLSLLTNKIKQTSLSRQNEPLVYKANDEIGLLVKEYNKMLLKLEESKTALAISEKEAAWREMAKQVAHEIKNPLTPMKLMLQNLLRALKSKNDNINELTERSAGILLEQVDNLSDIATSFSAFTQMPVPKRQLFEVSSLLKKAVFLFQNKEGVSMQSDIEDGTFYMFGDEKLMGRIFINLLTNALESVPENQMVDIKIVLKKSDNELIISISDNGVGIPAGLHNKVFEPNFSTKTSGSGIGLAVAKRGIEQMGGKIWFESADEKGSAFFITVLIHEAGIEIE